MIFTDSATSIDITTAQRQMKKRSSHWEPKLFIIKEAEKEGLIHLVKIPTADNPADTLTKPLAEKTFEKHLKNSGSVRSLKEGVEGGCISGTGRSNPRSIHPNTVATVEEFMSSVEPGTCKPRTNLWREGVISVEERSTRVAPKSDPRQRTTIPDG